MPGTLSGPLSIIVLDPQNMILGDMLVILHYYNKHLSHSTYKEKNAIWHTDLDVQVGTWLPCCPGVPWQGEQ